jgi:hypothetical protein
MSNLLAAYLTAVENGDEATATELLDRMDAEADRKFETHKANLDEAAAALEGLFRQADEIMSSDLYQ